LLVKRVNVHFKIFRQFGPRQLPTHLVRSIHEHMNIVV
jgi:hypothetical protein